MTATMEEIQITPLPLADLQASPTNPRKHFNEEALKELAASIAEHGVVQPLIVRPRWCVGWDGDPENEPLDKQLLPVEIVAGERRFRAATLAGIEAVPCIVSFLGNSAALEIQLIENLQRQDLTPIEEAESLAAAMSLRTPAGEPFYTEKTLGEKIGRDQAYVHRSLSILCIPDVAKTALVKGEIGFRQAAEIGRIKDDATREEVAQRVLKPAYQSQPLSFKATQDIVRTAIEQNEEDVEHQKWMEEVGDPEAKRRPLSRTANSAAMHDDGALPYNTPYVRANSKPDDDLLKKNAKPSPWKVLVKGTDIETVLIRHKGKTVELYDRKKAIAAAKLNGHSIFKEDEKKQSAEDKKKAEREESVRRTIRERTAARFREGCLAVAEKGMSLKQRREIFEILTEHGVATDTLEGVAEVRGLKSTRELASLIQKMTEGGLDGVFLDMCFFINWDELADVLDYQDKVFKWAEQLGKALSVDIKGIYKTTAAEVKAEMAAKEDAEKKALEAEGATPEPEKKAPAKKGGAKKGGSSKKAKGT